MEIDLQKWANFETENPHAVNTQAIVNQCLCAYLNTTEEEIPTLEPLFPLYRSLQAIGIVSDIPELIEVPDEDDEEGDENDEDED